MDFLSGIPTPVWAALVSTIVLGYLARVARKPVDHEAGWTVMRPSGGVYVVAVLSSIMAFLFALMSVSGLSSLFSGHTSVAALILPVLALPLTALMGFSAARLFFVQIRFNDAGVESHAYGRTAFAPWQDIVRFDRAFLLGPVLHLKDGRRIAVYQLLRGFPELVATVQAHGIPVALTPQR